ncbi:hypothetical protein HW555_013581 [Spodoptera exigua]|uniref:Uncharacterized protein n=1 Tax=Spodoptera exigua TaxID=7107 RepID=A0A835KWV0_SPOEX|nr:hypothetical protein HW555_013581 [Spodoptera exigua]
MGSKEIKSVFVFICAGKSMVWDDGGPLRTRPITTTHNVPAMWKVDQLVWKFTSGVTVDIEVTHKVKQSNVAVPNLDLKVSEDVPPVQRSAPLLQSPQYTGGRPQPYILLSLPTPKRDERNDCLRVSI